MKLKEFKENYDGSADVEIEVTNEENSKLLEYAVNNLLRDYLNNNMGGKSMNLEELRNNVTGACDLANKCGSDLSEVPVLIQLDDEKWLSNVKVRYDNDWYESKCVIHGDTLEPTEESNSESANLLDIGETVIINGQAYTVDCVARNYVEISGKNWRWSGPINDLMLMMD